jgi:hypothetical protein
MQAHDDINNNIYEINKDLENALREITIFLGEMTIVIDENLVKEIKEGKLKDPELKGKIERLRDDIDVFGLTTGRQR